MTQTRFKVQAFWDSEAEVWVATSEDVPGLATEASTIEVLMQKLREMIPELILLNMKISRKAAKAQSFLCVFASLREVKKLIFQFRNAFNFLFRD